MSVLQPTSFFQQPEMLAVYAEVPGMRPFEVSVTRGERMVARVQGYICRESGWKGWFSRRAIVQGGPEWVEDVTENEVEQLLGKLRKATSDTIYTEIRNEHDYSIFRKVFESKGFKYRGHLNVLIDCDSRAAMLERMDANRRRSLKAAALTGLELRYAATEGEVLQFYRLLSDHYRRKVGKPVPHEAFFPALYRKKLGRFLLAYKGTELVGGMLQTVLPGRVVYDYYVAAHDARYPDHGISSALYWQTMQNAVEEGIPLFDTMGAGRPGIAYGVRDFKQRFGGRTVEYGRYLLIHKPLLYYIGCLGVGLMRLLRRTSGA